MGKHTKPTPTVLRIQEHYRRIGLDKPWGVDRMHRLCTVMNYTPDELRALCNCSMKSWLDYLRYGKFPTHISLHFALIEQFYVAMTTGHMGEPIVPLIKKDEV
jgi:hypothetical protein